MRIMQTYKSMRRECAKFLHTSCSTTSILERGLALSYSLPRAASDMMAKNAVFFVTKCLISPEHIDDLCRTWHSRIVPS